MGADDGLDVVVSNAGHKPNINGAANNASGEGDDIRVLDTGPKSGIGGTKGGISPLFFSSMSFLDIFAGNTKYSTSTRTSIA